MQNEIILLFIISSFLFFIAGFPLILRVLKRKDVLEDYSPFGAVITTIAIIITMTAHGLMNNWISVVLTIPALVLWLLSSFYSTRRARERCRKWIRKHFYNSNVIKVLDRAGEKHE